MPVLWGVAALVLFVIWGLSQDETTVPGTTCMTLSYAQILVLAQNAGFGDDAPTAAAIALAESSGRTAVEGDVALGGSIGLWQIYTVMHHCWTPAQLTDPATNAAAAFQIYQAAGGFSPWTTYKTGAYKKYLPTCCGGCNDCTCAG